MPSQAAPRTTDNPEANFTALQKKYLQSLAYIVGNARLPKQIVNACDKRLPANREAHHLALKQWETRNAIIVDMIEKRRATVVNIHVHGNIVKAAEMERAFNDKVTTTMLKMFSETDSVKNENLCSSLDSLFASGFYDFQSDQFGMVKVVIVVTPAQLEAWYKGH